MLLRRLLWLSPTSLLRRNIHAALGWHSTLLCTSTQHLHDTVIALYNHFG
ncbi:Uncharacterised protein [Vibrio cholerae]|nr:Uncharacterised protein [Vibrio cholerae]CSC71631.1 Uncharacterised protein [Vibrio cholerae]